MEILNLFNLSVKLGFEDPQFIILADGREADCIIAIFDAQFCRHDCKLQIWEKHRLVEECRIPTMGKPSSDPRKEVVKEIKSWAFEEKKKADKEANRCESRNSKG